MHSPPAGDNFYDEQGNSIKATILTDYNKHMGCADKADRMTNRTWKWTKTLFFHLLDLTILNSFILSSSCVAKLAHLDFRFALGRNMLVNAASDPARPQRLMCLPAAPSTTISHLQEANRCRWPTSSDKRMNCRVCSSRGKRRSTLIKFKKNVTWDYAFSSASRSTTQRREACRQDELIGGKPPVVK
jgi:hypothetical protein